MKFVLKDKVHLETSDVQQHLDGAPWPLRERLQKQEWVAQVLMVALVMGGLVALAWVATH